MRFSVVRGVCSLLCVVFVASRLLWCVLVGLGLFGLRCICVPLFTLSCYVGVIGVHVCCVLFCYLHCLVWCVML